MKKNVTLKVCAALAFATCLSAGVATATAEVSANAATQMTCLGASTKIVSNLQDSGLAFKYSLDSDLFASTDVGTVAFDTGVSAGVIICPGDLPEGFDVTDAETYGSMVKAFDVPANYWSMNAESGEMEGIVYLYNIPNLDYDTEVTAIGYVTAAGETTYTDPTVRTMAYVAQQSIEKDNLTDDQKSVLKGFYTIKDYYGASLLFEPMQKSDFFTKVEENSATAADENKVTISDEHKAAINETFGDYVYATTAGVKSYCSVLLFTREYVDAVFADDSVMSFEFDLYCNNRVMDYRVAWGTAGTAALVAHNVGTNGVFTVSISRSDYYTFCETVDASNEKDPNTTNGKFAFSIMIYAKESDGTVLKNNVYVAGNFRVTNWYLEDYVVDFEDGKASPYIVAGTGSTDIYTSMAAQSFSSISVLSKYADTKFGNYGWATTEAMSLRNMGVITISREYLDAVFANPDVESITFDVACQRAIQRFRLYVGDSTLSEGDKVWATKPNLCGTNADTSGVFYNGTCLITRAAYEKLNTVSTTADLTLRLITHTDSGYAANTDSRIYFDNFTPVLKAE